jgi:dUTP pyrophosphatase
VPTYAHDGDAGADVGAAVDVLLPHGSFVAVPTGTRVAIPRGFVGLICPRSGLAARHGVTVLNAPGIIDSGFRDEIKVVLINHGSQSFQLHAGDRIAQILIMPIAYATFVSVDSLDATERGDGGFGSTGV